MDRRARTGWPHGAQGLPAEWEIWVVMAVSPSPVQRLIAYHVAIQKLDFEGIASMFAENASYHSNGVGSLKGRSEIMRAFRDYFACYGDQQSLDTLVEPLGHDAARAFWQLKATHSITGKISLRSGVETVYFNDQGLISLVDVVDD